MLSLLERSKWSNKTAKFAVLYDEHDVPFGYTVTSQEADMICNEFPQFQWDMNQKRSKGLPLVVFSELIADRLSPPSRSYREGGKSK